MKSTVRTEDLPRDSADLTDCAIQDDLAAFAATRRRQEAKLALAQRR